MENRRLPTHPPPQVIAVAKAAFSTDQTRGGTPVFTAGSDPFLACLAAVRATWRCARALQAGQEIPDPPDLPRLGRCTGCGTLLRFAAAETSPGAQIPLELRPHREGIAALIPTCHGPRARIYPSVTTAQIAGGTRYRTHWPDCSHTPTPPREGPLPACP